VLSPTRWLTLTAALFLAIAPRVSAQDAGARDTSAKADYVLQPSDQLHVMVFQEDDLQRDVRISQEYSITLPLIGQVDLKGKTLHEAEVLIRDLYNKDYLVNPQVTVSLLEYSKTSVNVLGSVGQPGSVVFPPEQSMTLLDAIARAGGFSRLADRRHVSLSRTVDGKVEKYTINADELIQGNAKQTWPLIKDDVIYVPEKLL
jgi:polysaccharide export outer membrane protein